MIGLAAGTGGAERAPKRRIAVFVGGVALAVGVALAAFSLLLRPATNDLAAMTTGKLTEI